MGDRVSKHPVIVQGCPVVHASAASAGTTMESPFRSFPLGRTLNWQPWLGFSVPVPHANYTAWFRDNCSPGNPHTLRPAGFCSCRCGKQVLRLKTGAQSLVSGAANNSGAKSAQLKAKMTKIKPRTLASSHSYPRPQHLEQQCDQAAEFAPVLQVHVQPGPSAPGQLTQKPSHLSPH